MIKINLNNIELNKPYSRKTLCELLEEPCKTGKAQYSQNKEFSRYMKIEETGKNRGKRYIIREIYCDKQIQTNLKKKIKHSKYQDHTQVLIASYVAKNLIDNKHMITSYNDLAKNTNIVNKILFSELFTDQANLLEDFIKSSNTDLSYYNLEKQIHLFRYYLMGKVRKIIKTTLNALKNRLVLDYDEVTYVTLNNNVAKKLTTPEDKNKLRTAKLYAIKELGVKTETMAIKHHFKKYYKLLSEYALNHYEWRYIKTRIEISSCDAHLNNYLSDYTIQPYDVLAKDCSQDLLNKHSKIVSKEIQNSLSEYPKTELEYRMSKYIKPHFGETPESWILNATEKTKYLQTVWDVLNTYIESLVSFDIEDLLDF